jgi:AraC-like DNA-binding protein
LTVILTKPLYFAFIAHREEENMSPSTGKHAKQDDFDRLVPEAIASQVSSLNLDTISLHSSRATCAEHTIFPLNSFLLPPSYEKTRFHLADTCFDFSTDVSRQVLPVEKNQSVHSEVTGPCRPYTCGFFADGCLEALAEDLFDAPAVHFEPRMYAASEALRMDVARILEESVHDESGTRDIEENLATIMAVDLLRCTLPSGSLDRKLRTRHPGIRKAVNLIERDFGERLTNEHLAETVGLSRSHFIVQFRHETGLTPHEHLRNVRIEAAQRLLRSGRDVTDTCFEVGYSSMSAFERAFIRRVRMTPRDFRSSQRS